MHVVDVSPEASRRGAPSTSRRSPPPRVSPRTVGAWRSAVPRRSSRTHDERDRAGAGRAARRPRRARGVPLAAARRVGAAQHQREPVPAARRVRRPLAGRAARRVPLQPLSRPRRARAPRRAGHATSGSRRSGCSAPTARTRCCRRSCSPTAGPVGGPRCSSPRTRCTRTSPASPAPRWSSGSGAPTSRSTSTPRARSSPSSSPRSCSCAARTTRPAPSSRHRHHRGAARRDRRPRRRRRGVRRVRAAERARPRARRRPPRRGAHVLEGVVDGRAAARLRGRAAVGRRASSRRSCSRTTSPRPRRSPAGSRSSSERRDGRASRPARRRAGAVAGRTRRASTRVTAYPSGANFVLFKVHGDGHALWQRAGRPRRARARLLGLAPPRECLRVTVGTPDENDAFLAALRESVREVAA